MASIIGFGHQYAATSGSSYQLDTTTVHSGSASAAIGDVIVLFCGYAYTSANGHATAVLSGALASGGFVEKSYVEAGVGTGSSICTCLTAIVTTAGTVSIACTIPAGTGDLGFDAFIVRGLSGAVAAVGTNIGATNPLVLATLSPAVTSSLFVYYINEQNNSYVSWTSSITITHQNNDNTHWDASGYALGVSAGDYTPGINVTTSGITETLTGIFMTEGSGSSATAAWLRA